MILCDSNIFISAFNGRQDTIDELQKIGLDNILLPAMVIMELYQGMGNKKELNQMKKRLKHYSVLQIDKTTSEIAVSLIDSYHLSHGLKIPDALIAASALISGLELYTYNLKDFSFITSIKLYKPEP
jgi:predicted nucleic acid-binding protein